MPKTFKNLTNGILGDRNFNEILRGSLWVFAAQICAVVLGLLVYIAVSRRYGASAMGVVALINSVLTLLTMMVGMGTHGSLLRLLPQHISGHSLYSAFLVYRQSLKIVLLAAGFAGALLWLGAEGMAEKVFNKPDTAPYLSLTAIALVLAALVPVNRSSLRSLGLIRTFALLYTMPHATTLVLLGALTFTAQTQDAPVYAVLGGSMLTGIAGLLIVEAYFRSNMDRNSAVEHLQPAQILNLSVPILLSSVFMMVIAQAGVIISGVFLTEAEVGYLAIAAKLAGLTAFVLTAINAVMAPRFSKLHHAGKIQELLDEASRSARLIFVAAAPILLTLVIGGNAIIGFFFGPEFQQAYGALLILMIGQTINAACGSTGIFMNMTGHQKELRNAVALAACISIGLHFALIPTMGIYGAAIATAAGIAIWNISAMLFIRKSFGRSIGYFPLLSKWRSS